MKVVPLPTAAEPPVRDPAALGCAVLLLADAARAGVQIELRPNAVAVSCDADDLTEQLAGRLREQRSALLEIGRAVMAARHAPSHHRQSETGFSPDDDTSDLPF